LDATRENRQKRSAVVFDFLAHYFPYGGVSSVSYEICLRPCQLHWYACEPLYFYSSLFKISHVHKQGAIVSLVVISVAPVLSLDRVLKLDLPEGGEAVLQVGARAAKVVGKCLLPLVQCECMDFLILQREFNQYLSVNRRGERLGAVAVDSLMIGKVCEVLRD